MFAQKKPKLTREQVFQSRPFQAPVTKKEEIEKGGVRLTYTAARPKWQRVLGAPENATVSFELDAYGWEVYEACNGKSTVREIIKNFAVDHNLAMAEAELSVTTFLKTLIGRGLVAVEVDKKKAK